MDSLQLVRANNKFNNSYDDFAGGGNASPGLNPGQLGLIAVLTKGHALQNSDLDVGTLYEGEYQYVELDTTPIVDSEPVIPVRGMLVFWTDRANYKVSTDDTVRSELAGVFLNAIKLDSAGDPIDPAGTFVWIQKVGIKASGRATVKQLTGETFAADDVVQAAGDGTALSVQAAVETDYNAFTVGLAEDAADVNDMLVVRLGA